MAEEKIARPSCSTCDHWHTRGKREECGHGKCMLHHIFPEDANSTNHDHMCWDHSELSKYIVTVNQENLQKMVEEHVWQVFDQMLEAFGKMSAKEKKTNKKRKK